MPKPVVVAILTFPGCQVLDVTGPAMVFGGGNDALGRTYYKCHILSAEGGLVRTSCAVTVDTESIDAVSPSSIDTLLIAGGDEHGLEKLAATDSVRQWVISASKKARRYGSICSGAFVLAHFGLLDGKRVATHWSNCAELAERWPEVNVDKNALFVNEGQLWTSAGVTTGIDMSLEMVSTDVGSAVAHTVAKRLVLYARRPGYQAQFSPILNAQSQAEEPFATLIQWMRENLAQPLDVPTLADKVAMSERTFLRKFTKTIGETPAHFVETLRLDQTRNLLAAGLLLKEIAGKTGYSTATQLSKAFDRRFGMTPMLFRDLHCPTG
ncbi:MAG: GlxA family transcriptional regulator [Pseudomonadota bacterium]